MKNNLFSNQLHRYIHADYAKRCLAWLFIIFNTYAAIAMSLPRSWAYRRLLVNLVYPILATLGIFHYLPLVSPPVTMGRNIDFVVGFNNGQSVNWKYPRQRVFFCDPPGTFRRYIQQFLWWHGQQHTQLYPAFARFIARQNNTKERHPVWVQFWTQEKPTPPLEDKSTGNDANIRSYPFFTYHVSSEDLQCL